MCSGDCSLPIRWHLRNWTPPRYPDPPRHSDTFHTRLRGKKRIDRWNLQRRERFAQVHCPSPEDEKTINTKPAEAGKPRVPLNKRLHPRNDRRHCGSSAGCSMVLAGATNERNLRIHVHKCLRQVLAGLFYSGSGAPSDRYTQRRRSGWRWGHR